MGRLIIMVCVAFALAFGGVTWAMREYLRATGHHLGRQFEESQTSLRDTGGPTPGRSREEIQQSEAQLACDPSKGPKLMGKMAPYVRGVQNLRPGADPREGSGLNDILQRHASSMNEMPAEIRSQMIELATSDGTPCLPPRAIGPKLPR